MPQFSERRLHYGIWLVFPPLMLLAIWLAGIFDPTLADSFLRKDDVDGGGIVEHLTVIMLLPAAWFGIRIATRYRNELASTWLVVWFVLWATGAFYFGMEEISWGQWVFGWETPSLFKDINPDGETNLHNIGNLGNRTPRSMLELWMIVSGLILCTWWARKQSVTRFDALLAWIIPGIVCVPTVVIYVFVRGARRFGSQLGDVELREYYIACFILLYLVSSWYRARQLASKEQKNSADIACEP